jgi:hypothetical protein
MGQRFIPQNLKSTNKKEIGMIVYLGDGAIAATGTEDDAPSDEVGVDGLDERTNIVRQPSPPIFYKNDMGAMTNRRQFRKFYEYELASGRPIGPHVFVRR